MDGPVYVLRGNVFEAFQVGQAAIDLWDTVASAAAEFNRTALPQSAASYPILRGKRFVRETFRLKLQKFDGSQLFRQDATFKMLPGLADGSWSSFESVNYPGHYIRHRNFHLYLERGNDDLFRKDSTFRVAPPNS